MADALIGYSGFVGATLLRQRAFQARYRSTDINEIRGKSFDLVICAGVPAQKWIANKQPDQDKKNIEGLIANLQQVTCQRLILISTVDVFKTPIAVDEHTRVEEEGLQAYGLHRRLLEKFVERHFQNHLVVRLPGLVGPGLRKNAIYDVLNSNNTNAIDARGVFQFYPMVNLWSDLRTALANGLKLVHLTAQPVSVAEVVYEGFGQTFENTCPQEPARYDLRTQYAEMFGAPAHYQYSKRETIQAVRHYAQSEPKTLNT
jgi:hypothetical protein